MHIQYLSWYVKDGVAKIAGLGDDHEMYAFEIIGVESAEFVEVPPERIVGVPFYSPYERTLTIRMRVRNIILKVENTSEQHGQSSIGQISDHTA